jgi:hypothetical protein
MIHRRYLYYAWWRCTPLLINWCSMLPVALGCSFVNAFSVFSKKKFVYWNTFKEELKSRHIYPFIQKKKTFMLYPQKIKQKQTNIQTNKKYATQHRKAKKKMNMTDAGKPLCSGRVSRFCSMCDTRCFSPVTNPVYTISAYHHWCCMFESGWYSLSLTWDTPPIQLTTTI